MTTPTGGGSGSGGNFSEYGIKFTTNASSAQADMDKLIPTAIGVAKGLDEVAASSDKVDESFKKAVTSGRVTAQEYQKYQERLRQAAIEQGKLQSSLDELSNAGTRFLSQLKRQEETLGMTRTEIMRYDAALLGVAKAADQSISAIERYNSALAEQKQTARDMVGETKREIELLRERARAIEYAANAQMIANDQVSQRNSASGAYAIEAQMRAEESASLRRQALRRADEAALEDHVKKEIDSYNRISAAAERAANAQMIANDQVSQRRKKEADDAAKAAERAANAQMVANDQVAQRRQKEAEDAAKAAEKKALDEIHWAQKSAREQINELMRLRAYQQNPNVSQGTIDGTFSKAAQENVHRLDQMIKEYNKTAHHTNRIHAEGGPAAGSLRAAFDQISFGSSRARAEMIVLAHEMVQGRFSRIPGSLMVFAEYTNASALVMSGLGAAVLATVAAVAAFGYSIIGAEVQVKKLNDALNRTNQVSGLTTQGLTDIADAAGRLHGNYSDAYEAATKLAGSGKFTAEQLAQIIPVVTQMEHYFGGSLADSIKEYESLIVRSSTKGIQSQLGVSRALLDLNDKYHFLQTSQLQHILNLEKEGRMREASAEAIRLYTAEGQRASVEAEKYMGTMLRMWHGLLNNIQRAKQAMLDFGKTQTLEDQRQKQLLLIQQASQDPFISEENKKRTIADATKKLIEIQKQKIAADKEAEEQSKKQMAQDEANNVLRLRMVEDDQLMKRTTDELTYSLKKFHEQNLIIEKAMPGYMQKEAAYLKEREAKIRAAHAPKKEAKETSSFSFFTVDTSEIDRAMQLVEKTADQQERIIKQSMDSRRMAEDEGYEALQKVRNDELAQLEVWYQKRLTLINKYQAKMKPEQYRKAVLDLQADKGGKEADINNELESYREDKLNKEAKAYDKLMEQIDRAGEKELDRLDKAIQKQREHNEGIGKTDEQKALGLEKLAAAQARQNELEAEAYRQVLANKEITDTMTPKQLEIYQRHLAYLDQSIARQNELTRLRAEGAKLEADSPELKIKDAAKLAKDWKQAGDTIGDSLVKAFGRAGKSAGDMFKSFAQGQARQSDLNKELIREQAAAVGLKDEEARKQEALDKYNAQTARNQVNTYGDMAGAAAGFFDEQSKGYQALMTMSKIFHAAELAMTMAELVPKATAAILNQGTGDPYSAFARMAAMAAIVAGLGVAVGAVGSGPSTVAKDRQAAAGKGSVLGMDDEKSDSIAKSLERLEEDSNLGLVHSGQMVNSLRTIASNISGLTSLVLRTQGITTKPEGLQEGYEGSNIRNALGGGVVGLVAGFIPGLDKLMSKLFGTKTTLVDQGVVSDRTTLGQIRANGLDVDTYNTVNTKKKFLGFSYSDKTRETRSEMDGEIEKQFALVIEGMATSVIQAADMLGLGGQEFIDKMNNFVVDIGHVSFKDMDAKEIEEQFQAIFSKVGDDMAKFGLSGLAEFQKAGEGYFETTIRLASNLQQVKDVFQVVGVEFNKTGIDALRFSEYLIEASGGVEELTGATADFVESFYTESERVKVIGDSVASVLAGMGLATNMSMKEFRNLAVSMLNGTKEGADMYAALMKIAPAFAEVRKAEEEILESRLDLLQQIAELEGNDAALKKVTTQIRQRELDAMDASLRPLQMRVWALEEEVAATEKAADIAASRRDMLLKIAELEKNEGEVKRITAEMREVELKALDESLRPLQSRIWALEDEAAATAAAKNAADEYAQAMDEIKDKLMSNMDVALAGVQRAVNAVKEDITALYNMEVEAFNKSIELRKTALKDRQEELRKELDLAKDSVSAIKSVFDTLSKALESTEIGSAQMDKVRRQEAQRYLSSIVGTDLTKATGLESALEDLAKPSKAMFSNFLDYARDQARTASTLGVLRGQSGAALTDAEKQVKAIEDQIKAVEEQTKALDDYAKAHLDMLKKQFDIDLKRQDDIYKAAKEQTEILKGVDISIKSVADAMRDFNGSVAAVKAQNIVAAGPTGTVGVDGKQGSGGQSAEAAIESLYGSLLGRKSEAAGLKFWTDALKNGVSIEKITQDFKNSEEYKNKHGLNVDQKLLNMLNNFYNGTPGFAVGTNEIPNDMVAKVHKGERIIPAADNRELMSRLASPNESNRMLVAEVKALRNEVVALREANSRENAAIQKDTAVSANKLKRIETQGVAIKEA